MSTQAEIEEHIRKLTAQLSAEIDKASSAKFHSDLEKALSDLNSVVDAIIAELSKKELSGDAKDSIASIKSLISEAEAPLVKAVSHHAVLDESHSAHKENLSASEFSLSHWDVWSETVDATQAKIESIGLTRAEIQLVKNKLSALRGLLDSLKSKESVTATSKLREYDAFQKASSQLISYLDVLKSAMGGAKQGDSILSFIQALHNWKKK